MIGLGEVAPTAGLPPRLRDLLPGRQEPFAVAAARFIGVTRLALVSSGTAALRVAFACLKQRSPRRQIIVPAYTCPLVVEAAALEGLSAVACDVVPDGLDLDLDHLARLIGPHTLAVVPTHYFGWLADVERVRRAASAIDPAVVIVEDAAQAFGARWHGMPAGTLGDIGILSFGVGKGVTTYAGGGLVARDEALMASLSQTADRLSRRSLAGEIGAAAQLAGYHLLYTPLGLRLVHGAPRRQALRRGDDIAAAGDALDGSVPVRRIGSWRQRVATAALVRLSGHLDAARRQFALMAAELEGIAGVKVHRPPSGVEPTCLSMLVTLPAEAVDRGALASLWRSRHGMGKMYARALGDYPALQGMLGASATPNAIDLARRTLTLSTAGGLMMKEHSVKAVILKALGRGSRGADHAAH